MKLFSKKEYPFYTKSPIKTKKNTLNGELIAICATHYTNVDTADHTKLLLSAAYNGNNDDLKMLLAAGLDPEALHGEGQNGLETALSVAIHGNRIETIRFLVFDQGLNPLYMGTPKKPLCGNAFHAACLVGNVDAIQLLAPAFKTGLSERDYKTNSTPIADAIGNGRFACARMLIDNNFVDLVQNCMNKLNVLGMAFCCFVNRFIGTATSTEKDELVAFCLYLIDEKNMNPFVETNGNRAPIDVLIEDDLGIAKLNGTKPGTLINIANKNKDTKNFSNDEKKYDHLYLMLIRLNITHPEGQPLAQRLLALAKEEYANNSTPKAKQFTDAYAYFESQNPQLKAIPQPDTNSRSTSSSLGSSGEQS